MKLKKNLFLFLTAITFISCGDNQSDHIIINSYPMSIGSIWTYDKTATVKYYESVTSDKIMNSDTVVMEGTTWIEKDTIINNSKVMVFKTIENHWGSITTTADYHLMDNEGLKLIADYYSGYMSSSSTKKTLIKPSFQSLSNEKMNSQSKISSGVYIYNALVLNIKYPLTSTSEWTSVYPVKINKKVIGTDKLQINGHEYVCLKVLWECPGESTLMKIE